MIKSHARQGDTLRLTLQDSFVAERGSDITQVKFCETYEQRGKKKLSTEIKKDDTTHRYTSLMFSCLEIKKEHDNPRHYITTHFRPTLFLLLLFAIFSLRRYNNLSIQCDNFKNTEAIVALTMQGL